jgi:hypothetical protein
MATTMASLWPEAIRPGIQSPKMLLDIQAKALNEQTRGYLTGAVTQVAISSGAMEFTELKFAFVAPAIGYDYPVLTILHEKDLPYPLIVLAEEFENPNTENLRRLTLLEGRIKFKDIREDPACARTDEGLLKILKHIFSSSRVVAIAQSLIARVEEEAKREDAGSEKLGEV